MDKLWLIDEVGPYGTDYSLVGHRSLKTHGHAVAWETHDDLELIEPPSIKRWKQLIQARDQIN